MIYESASFSLNRKEFQRATGWERCLRAEREWDKKVINKRKGYFRQDHLPLREGRVCQADYFPVACQEISFLGVAELKLV